MPEKDYTVFGYVRVSTENQLDNYSIEEQSSRIKAFCAAKGWTLLNIYTDGGYSGGNTDRPALAQMLQAVHSGHVDAVVVYKLDRLSRSQKDTLFLIEDQLLTHGTDFVSINENFDTSSPFGKAMIGILSVFAQLEKDQITERFTMGRIGRGKAGYYHGGGFAPTGYTYADGLLHVNEYEAIQVRQVFRLFLEGKSINAIGKQLNWEYASGWTAAKVRNVLKNSLYTGKIHFRGQEYDGIHEPLVTPETFAEANRILHSFERQAQFTTWQRSPFRAGYLLSGLLVCGNCGARYSANHGFYKCYSRAKSSMKHVMDPNCKNKNWAIPALDALVVSQIEGLLSNHSLLNSITHSCIAEVSPPSDRERTMVRIREIERQTEKLIELYQLNSIPMDLLTKRIEVLTNEKNALAKQLEREETVFARKPLRNSLQEYTAGFAAGGLEQKRALLSSLIARITVEGERIRIQWRL